MSTTNMPVGLFCPSDSDLASYLKSKNIGEIQPGMEFIGEIDVYDYEPWDLPARALLGTRVWYFFVPLKNMRYTIGNRGSRATKTGYWKCTGKDWEITSAHAHNLIGMRKTLVFYQGRAPRGEKTNWVMNEFRTIEPEFESGKEGAYVLCKLFRKSHGPDQVDVEVIEIDDMESTEASYPSGNSIIYGREYDKRRITELVLSNHRKNHDMNFICVISDRGIGKSTMLHLVHNDERVRDSFDKRLFVSMPDNFDDKVLIRMIIESVTGISCDATDLKTLEEIVKEELRGKKVLLVLDNFEIKDQSLWNIPLALLSVSLKRSAILVSTMSETASNDRRTVQCDYYYLNNLSDNGCWMIFCHYVFDGQAPYDDPNLISIGKKLVSKCANVPLCVKLLSGLLRHSVTEGWWKTVSENSSLWEMDETGDDIRLPVLKVCYDLLPSYLKKCLEYCSLYPKNYLFSKHYLSLKWLSRGFITPIEGTELEETGLQYFDELLSRSFFEHSPFHENKEDKFVMPGLIHDLAQSVSRNKFFRSEGHAQKVPENACDLSLVPYEYQSFSFKDFHLTTNTQNLESFMVVTRPPLQQESISSPVVNLVDLDDLLVKCVSLVTLDLSYTDVEYLPNSIGSLKNLRYFGLSGTKIKCIPSEISKLFHLQTLKAKDCIYLEKLPRNIQELVNLRHLDVTNESRCIIMPSGTGKLINLRTLSAFNVGIDQSQCGIEELENLNHLKGSLVINGLENVTDGINAKKADLRSKTYLENLSLNWSDIIICDEGVELAYTLFENLHPTYGISELIIRNYPGIKFPMWVGFSAFSHLVSIILDNCFNCENLPNLGLLPMLKHLSIQKMYVVQRLDLYNGYPSLEVLNIWEMYELEEWVHIRNGDFPRLKTVSINRCPFLRNVPNFPSLIELSIYNCTKLPEITELPSLESLKIEGFLKTTSIELPQNLYRLEKLEICQCPELASVEGLLQSTCIKNIIIAGCPKLDMSDNQRSVPLKEQSDPSVFSRGKAIDSNEHPWFELKKSKPSYDILPLTALNYGEDSEVLSKKRKNRGELQILVNELAQGEEELKVLEDHLNEQNQSTALKLLENVQTIIMQATDTAKSLADMDFNSAPHADAASSPAHSLQGLMSYSGVTEEVQSKQTKHQKDSKRRRLATWRTKANHLDDGYAWRKYGQKDMLNSKYPRFYYRCTHRMSQGCLATKYVQRTDEDPQTYDICYVGKHTCYEQVKHGASSISETAIFATEVTDAVEDQLKD